MRLIGGLILGATVLFGTAGCEEGDWLGPVERGLRAAVNGWDMWTTDAVQPYEDPMPPAVEGTVATDGIPSFESAMATFEKFSPDVRKERAALTYRRYCYHCHGQAGDARVIVGESLEIKPTDLRISDVQSKSDQELFEHLRTGGELMLPLAATLAPIEMILAIEHLRTLKNRPSKPFFKPQFDEPIR